MLRDLGRQACGEGRGPKLKVFEEAMPTRSSDEIRLRLNILTIKNSDFCAFCDIFYDFRHFLRGLSLDQHLNFGYLHRPKLIMFNPQSYGLELHPQN